MNNLKRIFFFFVLFAATAASQADAWHGFWGRGYGFGHNHQSFRPSIYNPGWSSYSRASFYSSYGYGGLGYSGFGYGSYWPRTSYYVSYPSYAPVYYSSYNYCAPSYYYVPTYYSTHYGPYVAPIIYSDIYSGFPSCAMTPVATGLPNFAYSVKKPVASSVPFRLASQPIQQSPRSQAPTARYVLAQGPNVSNSGLDTAPEELIAAADAILAAGGYRQAAQAYAQIVVKHGNSNRLVTRRFIAQVANGDYEQAAVVVELAGANGNHIDRSDLPQADLVVALGKNSRLIATRGESLAANALQKSEDAVAMLTVAHWLALSGDEQRAELFKARAEQMQQVTIGKLVSTKPAASTGH